jgi:hypothetical protein
VIGEILLAHLAVGLITGIWFVTHEDWEQDQAELIDAFPQFSGMITKRGIVAVFTLLGFIPATYRFISRLR